MCVLIRIQRTTYLDSCPGSQYPPSLAAQPGPRSAEAPAQQEAKRVLRTASWKSIVVSNGRRLLTSPLKCRCGIFFSLLRHPLTNSLNLIILACSSLSVHVFADLGVAGFCAVLAARSFRSFSDWLRVRGWTHISSGTPGFPDVEPQPQVVLRPVTSGSIRHFCMVRDGDRDVRRLLLLLPLKIDG